MKKRVITDKKRFALFIAVSVLVFAGLIWGLVTLLGKSPENQLKSAAKEGEMKTFQLMVMINRPKGNTETSGQSFQRGDIVLFAPEDKEFSIAEQEGFLIIKSRLTEQQANLLVSSLEQMKEQINPEEKPKENVEVKQVPLRTYAVDLKKIGIGDDQERGVVISDKVFDWKEIVIVKE